MEDRLEQIERLRQKANVSYEEAKNALDAADGDILEALIILERQGKVQSPSGNGFYSSAKEQDGATASESGQRTKSGSVGEGLGDLIDRAGRFVVRLINKGNQTNLEVLKDDDCKARCPLTVLVLLAIFAPWITLPLLVIGLILGYRYRMNGAEKSDEV
jgi:hypothetical protein